MKNENQSIISHIIEYILYVICYTLILFIVDKLFDSFTLDNIGYGVVTVLIISILNKTIKPIIFRLTLPLTGLTFGLFYPFINFFILKIVDILLGDHFNINGVFMGVLIAVLISIMNFIMEEVIIKPILRRCTHE